MNKVALWLRDVLYARGAADLASTSHVSFAPLSASFALACFIAKGRIDGAAVFCAAAASASSHSLVFPVMVPSLGHDGLHKPVFQPAGYMELSIVSSRAGSCCLANTRNLADIRAFMVQTPNSDYDVLCREFGSVRQWVSSESALYSEYLRVFGY